MSANSPLLKFVCTKCGSGVGVQCRAASGNVTYDSHSARYESEAAFYREKVPCLSCGTPVMRSYMPTSGVCTEC